MATAPETTATGTHTVHPAPGPCGRRAVQGAGTFSGSYVASSPSSLSGVSGAGIGFPHPICPGRLLPVHPLGGNPGAAPTHLRPGARKQQWVVTLSGARAAGTPGIRRGSSCLPNERGRRFGAGGYARRESTYRNHSYPHGICTCILPGPAVRRVSGRLYRLQSDRPSECSDIQLLCN